MLNMFYESVVASVLLYAALEKKVLKETRQLVRKADFVIGARLNPLEKVVERRTLKT